MANWNQAAMWHPLKVWFSFIMGHIIMTSLANEKGSAMSLLRLIFIGVMVVLLSACVSVDPDGNSRFSLLDPKDPAKEGERYLLGRGVAADEKKAFHYFQLAANDGDAFAQNEVAYMYAAGKGTNKNYEKALKYFRLAADQDLASAQYNVGLIYQEGLGVSRDPATAKSWFKLAARHGFEPAKQELHS